METNSDEANAAQEFVVRIPRNSSKKYSVMKTANNVLDFSSISGSVKIERENNMKQFKLASSVEELPKFGAGSEFGREDRDEARRKKYGILLKKYNPEKQPWILKHGSGKAQKKLKGTKEGGVSENASYYIFTHGTDGAFEAVPVNDWYNFAPIIKYKYLDSEEAEEEFSRRDKRMNYFSIMVKKRLKKGEDEELEDDESSTKTKKKRKKGNDDLMLTEMEDWGNISDDDNDNSSDDNTENDKANKKHKNKVEKKKKDHKNSDDEAIEESDDQDEGAEVDYMTDTNSEDEDMYDDRRGDEKEDDEGNKYDDKAVADEDGLKSLIDSEDEDEEDTNNAENQKENGSEELNKEKTRNEGSNSESSDSSGSDSDPEKETTFASALFMQKKSDKKKIARRESTGSEGSAANSRSNTPTTEAESLKKRKHDDPDSIISKKSRPCSPTTIPVSTTSFLTNEPSSQSSSKVDGITEEAVKRYLMRKPMTTVDLLQKFRPKNPTLSKQNLVQTIVQILKKLNPERTMIKDKLHLFIKNSN